MSHRDLDILRSLAEQVRTIADLPEMEERKQRWYRHNALERERPLVLCFPEGAWTEILPESVLQCEDPVHRKWEHQLRSQTFWWDHIRDDNVLEPIFEIQYQVVDGDFGVEIPVRHGDHRGSYIWDPPMKDIASGLGSLKFREPRYLKQETDAEVARAESVFDGILPIRMRGNWGWSMGLTWKIIDLLGLEQFMLSMIDEPDQVHQLMAWMRDEHRNHIGYYEQNGLLTLNNRNHYTGSGGVAYTHELPTEATRQGGPVQLADLWGFSESQETVGISPDMFEEFIFPYQLPLLELFGLTCYGCCEPVHLRWHVIKKIPNLRRVSCSPWVDQEFMTEALGRDYIFSRKPNPTLVCLGFDEEQVRADLRHTMDVAGGGVLEVILKDTHTVQGDATRLTRWVQIAIQEAEQCASNNLSQV